MEKHSAGKQLTHGHFHCCHECVTRLHPRALAFSGILVRTRPRIGSIEKTAVRPHRDLSESDPTRNQREKAAVGTRTPEACIDQRIEERARTTRRKRKWPEAVWLRHLLEQSEASCRTVHPRLAEIIILKGRFERTEKD